MKKRSHFGNLQFLHAMATKLGEPAQTTKDKLMSWLEVMYKLACGDQGVSPNDKLAARFPNDFNDTTVPNGWDSVSMARKLTLLERGFAGIDAPEDFSNDRFRFLSHARHWYNRSWLKITVLRLNVATLLGLVAGMILFGFLSVWLEHEPLGVDLL